MKTKLLIILIFSFEFAICQTPVIQIIDSGSTDGFNKVFETLDTNYITTKILYDKVLPFVDIFKFDGIDSIGIATSDEWCEIYFEMNKGAVNTSQLPNITNTFQNANNIYTEQNIIPIGILNVKYNILKDSALENGLVYLQNGQIYDSPNKSESPYEEKRVFTVTNLKSNIQLSENKFIISDDFYFSNDTLPIDHFEIDFDDGAGFNLYQKNEIINIDYNFIGDKIVRLKIVFIDNSVLTAAFKMITASCDAPPYDFQLTFEHSTNPAMSSYYVWENTENENDKNGAYGKATITIWYAPGNHVLTKPFILLDGFDP